MEGEVPEYTAVFLHSCWVLCEYNSHWTFPFLIIQLFVESPIRPG